jgi:UDP-glucose 4-epimerase
MLNGEQPTIFGDGTQERDYVYVDDVVEANLSALSKGEGEAFNIGTGKTTSVEELFFKLQKIIGFKEKPIYGTQRSGELQRSCLDCSKAKQVLDWCPKKDLAKGLLETVEYFRKR